MNWRSLGDSNPCFRRERATSWAARRREQALPDSRSGGRVQAVLAGARSNGSEYLPSARRRVVIGRH
jgi:hypothetical protein